MKRKECIKAYAYLLPCLILASVFFLYPFLNTLISSLLRINTSGVVLGFAGLSNYALLFKDKSFQNSILRTLLFTSLFVPLNTFLTLLASSLTARKIKGFGPVETIFFLPVAISLSGATLIFKEMFRGRVSIINRLLGLEIDWLNERFPAMLTLVFLGVFLDFGIDYILLLTSFRAIDKRVLEAAEIDGASSAQIYFHIELPLIMRMLLMTVFLAIKDALLIVAPIIILTEGGPFRSTETILFYYYIEAFKSGNRAVQNTVSTLMVLSAALVMVIYSLIFHRRDKK